MYRAFLRDRSLITGMGGGGGGGRGGTKKGRGWGNVKFYSYNKWGLIKVLAMLKGGGGTKCFEVVLTRDTISLAMPKRVQRVCSVDKKKGGGGHNKLYTVPNEAGATYLRFSHFVAPPPSPRY